MEALPPRRCRHHTSRLQLVVSSPEINGCVTLALGGTLGNGYPLEQGTVSDANLLFVTAGWMLRDDGLGMDLQWELRGQTGVPGTCALS